jgi:hypothetical protein
LDGRSRNKISGEEKQELYQSVRQVIAATVKKIGAGEFTPLPKKLSHCEDCAWNRLCRAPHLG